MLCSNSWWMHLLLFVLCICTACSPSSSFGIRLDTQSIPLTSGVLVNPVALTSTPIATPTSSVTSTPPHLPSQTPSLTPTRGVLAPQATPVQDGYVLKLQRRLIEMGYAEVDQLTGVFDAQTEAAVRHFQWYNRMEVDGVVDEAVWQAVFAKKAVDNLFWWTVPYVGKEIALATTREICDDMFLQMRLIDLGYLGPSTNQEAQTNVYGPSTEKAVRQFQAAHQLTANGVVDWKTWERLMSPLAAKAGEAAVALPTRAPWTTTIFPVGKGPAGLAYDGSKVWVLLYDQDALQAIDPVSGYVSAPVRMGTKDCVTGNAMQGATSVLFAKGKLWVNLGNPPGALQSLDPLTGLVSVPYQPPTQEGFASGSAFGFDGQRLWVAAMDDKVRSVAPGTRQVFSTRTVGWMAMGVMAFDGACMWVGRGDGYLVSAFDPGIGVCRNVGDYPEMAPGALAVANNRIWSATDYLTWRELKGNQSMSEPIYLGGSPSAMVYDGKDHLWVALSGANAVVAVDVVTGQVSDPIPVGREPTALLFDGTRLWVVNHADNTVQYITLNQVSLPTRNPATATPTVTFTPTQPPLTRNLFLQTPNMSGDDVLQLQQRLLALGYSVGKPDGSFGPMTDAAVKSFQQVNGLKVDGIVGALTWAKLFTGEAIPAPTATPTPKS
jgi:YVTN family beta-propeller protein